MKTEPMQHQREGLRRLTAARSHFALGCEQGTGKTWMLLADAEQQFVEGLVSGLLVVTLNGVHHNWILNEIPKHLGVDYLARSWVSGAGKRATQRMRHVLAPAEDQLAIFCMSDSGLITKKGLAFAKEFCTKHRTMLVVDESQLAKNPRSARAKALTELRDLSVSKRIASGTLVEDKPLDLYAQYNILKPNLLGEKSYTAFVARYASILPNSHPLVRNIMTKSRSPYPPQIIEQDDQGRPQYKNLDKLRDLMAQHTYRVKKSDCLDLPEKIYTMRHFDLEKEQQKLYDSVEKNQRLVLSSGQISTFEAMTVLTKLQQITSGFVMTEDEVVHFNRESPRLAAAIDEVNSVDCSCIIWARYVEEIEALAAALPDAVTYYGATPPEARVEAIKQFQAGNVRVFIGSQAAAGTGIELYKAEKVIYYSNTFSLGKRSQSEDRAHRIGTRNPVLYVDLIAKGTIDEQIVLALQTKKEVADYVMN